jgi:small subunit ribosomal protein S4
MSKRINCKYKIDRRLGVNLWGRAKSPFNARAYAPGQHGQGRKKTTDYGVQLMAKQRLKGYYGNVGEKKFRLYFKEAERRKGDTGEQLVSLLESRLDAVVYRMKLAPTVFSARQLVSHGHVTVNGRRVNIASFSVSAGDEITVSKSLLDNIVLQSAVQSNEREVPAYMEIDHKQLKGKFLRTPQFDEIPYPVQMEPHLVVEFYSR